MSWQAYVDTNLLGSGQIVQAGIYGAQGGQWAASNGFQVSNVITCVLVFHAEPYLPPCIRLRL